MVNGISGCDVLLVLITLALGQCCENYARFDEFVMSTIVMETRLMIVGN